MDGKIFFYYFLFDLEIFIQVSKKTWKYSKDIIIIWVESKILKTLGLNSFHSCLYKEWRIFFFFFCGAEFCFSTVILFTETLGGKASVHIGWVLECCLCDTHFRSVYSAFKHAEKCGPFFPKVNSWCWKHREWFGNELLLNLSNFML